PEVALESGDTTVFSSKIIPGNEAPIEALHRRLRQRGVEVVSEREEFVHVSGHPPQDDLRQLYAWTRPPLVVPVHGEARHMEAHAALALECGARQTIVPFNGAVVRLAPGPASIVDRVPAGRVLVRAETPTFRAAPRARGHRRR